MSLSIAAGLPRRDVGGVAALHVRSTADGPLVSSVSDCAWFWSTSVVPFSETLIWLFGTLLDRRAHELRELFASWSRWSSSVFTLRSETRAALDRLR